MKSNGSKGKVKCLTEIPRPKDYRTQESEYLRITYLATTLVVAQWMEEGLISTDQYDQIDGFLCKQFKILPKGVWRNTRDSLYFQTSENAAYSRPQNRKDKP